MDFISVLILRYLCEANTSKQKRGRRKSWRFQGSCHFYNDIYVEGMGEGVANSETKNEPLGYNSFDSCHLG